MTRPGDVQPVVIGSPAYRRETVRMVKNLWLVGTYVQYASDETVERFWTWVRESGEAALCVLCGAPVITTVTYGQAQVHHVLFAQDFIDQGAAAHHDECHGENEPCPRLENS